ncbi:MAG TPA: hypothetical protein VGF74_02205 [Thermoleophilaceae bacterium]|jgi:hypothetical protein
MTSGFETTEAARSARGEYDAPRSGPTERGAGMLAFAGVMLAILGILNVIYGIAAISNSDFYVGHTRFIFNSLNGWGWVITIIGAAQVAAALSILRQTGWGRWLGVATAALNSIAQLLFIPSYPFASLALFAVDIVVIYALVAYGARRAPA